MIPRRSVTSLTRVSPVSLRTWFSLSFPSRYSLTATSIPSPLHSSKPASGPSVSPVPRSTRKLKPPYGRSRSTAIALLLPMRVLEPDEPLAGQLDLLHGHPALGGIE